MTYNAASPHPHRHDDRRGNSHVLLGWRTTRTTGSLDLDSLFFSITVEADIAPDFGDGVTIADQTFAVGETVALTLPAVATHGNGATRYQFNDTEEVVVDGASVLGLTYNAAARTLTGTVTAGTIRLSWWAIDSDSNVVDDIFLTFSITVEADAPDFGTVTIADQIFIQDLSVALTLPAVETPGNGGTSYTLSTPPAGLTFNAATRVLRGRPTAVTTATMYTYTARDSDDDTDTLTFSITVEADIAPDFGDGVTISNQIFAVGETVALTLPMVETPGNGTTQYVLNDRAAGGPNVSDGESVLGLTYNAAARTLTGTATAGRSSFGWFAHDSDASPQGDFDHLGFTITVGDIAPAFAAGATIADQIFFPDQSVALTLPIAAGGNGATTYTLTPALPTGLTFNPTARVLTGTPQALTSSEIFTYTASDSDDNIAADDTATLTFSITVEEDIAPDFGTATIPNQTFAVGETVALTLPTVETPGNGATRYQLQSGTDVVADGASVLGLTYNAAARTLTGTTTAGTLSFSWFAIDSVISNYYFDHLGFTITVGDIAPDFGAATIADQIFVPDQSVARTLPAATGGNGAITYTLTPAPPTGLTFNAASRVLSGTPQALTSSEIFTYTARDSDDNIATLTFSIAVEADIAPAFGDGVTIADQTFAVGETVALTLPAVETDGNGATRYYLTYPMDPLHPYDLVSIADGASVLGLTLTYNAAARTLTGTATAGAIHFYWEAVDSDNDTATLTFSITVEADAPDFGTVTIPDLIFIPGQFIFPLTLPAVEIPGNGGTSYTLSNVSTLPAGLTFNAATRALSGSPTAVTTATMYTYTARDSDNDTDTLTFSITVEAGIVPAFGDGVTIDNQAFDVGETVALTLPEVETPGNGATTYFLETILTNGRRQVADGESLLGLTYNAAARTLTGTTTAGTISFNWFAGDSDYSHQDDLDYLGFIITVGEDTATAPAFADGVTIADQIFVPDRSVALTLPIATGGNGAITYTLTPALSDGLTFNPVIRVLSGSPTAVTTATMYTYTARDSDANIAADDTDTLTFRITVEADIAPDFGDGVTISSQIFAVGETVALTLPVVETPGNGATQYVLHDSTAGGPNMGNGESVLGLTYNAAARTLTGTATAGTRSFGWSAHDSDANHQSDSDLLFFTITVGDIAPDFGTATIADQIFVPDQSGALTLPAVESPGNGPTTYTLTPAIAGLTLNPTTRVLSGRPTAVTPATTYTYTASDSDNNTAADDTDTLTFSITVEADIAPAFGGARIADRTFAVGETVALTLPAVETPGNGATRYFLYNNTGRAYVASGASVLGLTYNAAARTLIGTPTAAGTIRLFWFAHDSDASPQGDNDTLFFTITVEADIAPAFADGATIADQIFTQDQSVALTLPTVEIPGNGGTSYTLSAPPAGLTFNAATRVLSGSPTGVTTATMYAYTARDSDDDTDTLTFSITVEADLAPDFGMMTIDDQAFDIGETVALTLPVVATPGNGTTRYFLYNSTGRAYVEDGASVIGLTYNAAARTLTGTVTAGLRFFDWVARDSDASFRGDFDVLDFSITVEADAPDFGTVTIADQIFAPDRSVALTLPAVETPGNGGTSYTLSGTPAGLTFNAATRVLSGSPPAVTTATMYTYTARDSDDDTDTLTFSITVEADIVPAFGDGVTIDNQAFDVGETVALTLPEVETHGNGATTYFLETILTNGRRQVADGESLLGLTYNAAARTLTGTTTAGTISFNWFAGDSDNSHQSDSDLLFFTITVGDTAPDFADGATIADQIFAPDQSVALTLPAVESPGNGPTTYTLTPAIAGLTLNPTTRVLSGTPTAVTPATTYTYTASDSDNNTAADDTATLTFSITVEADIAPAFAVGVSIPDQTYIAGETVALTLPVAIGGNGALNYSLAVDGIGYVVNGASIYDTGLTYNAVNRTLTGTVTAEAFLGLVLYWDVQDSDYNTAADDTTATLQFSITVSPDTAPAFGMVVPDQSYIMGTAIPPLTLPQATRGNGLLRYTLTELPAGLTYDEATRILTGTPTTVQAAATYDYRVVDGDGNNTMADADLQMFTITVVAAGTDIAPTFGGVAMPDQFYVVNLPMPPLTLPAATGGNGAITYALTPALPAGLTFNAATRVLIGTPQALTSTEIFTYTASDTDPNTATGDTDTLTFSITVGTDIVPAFAAGLFIPYQTYIVGESVALTLPAVETPGNGPTFYSLVHNNRRSVADGESVLGLTYNAAARTLTGTVTAEAIFNSYEWVASDSDANNTADDVDSLRFFIRVEVDIAPAFAVTSIAAQTYRQDALITPLTLPRATGGNGDITYTLTPAIAGLTLNPTSRVLSGRPTAVTTATTYTYTARDSDDNIAADDTATLAFSITVEEDISPDFGDGVTIDDQTYIMGQMITPLTLPVVEAPGNGGTSYTLTPPIAGLTLNPTSRVLSGAPTTVTTATMYTYTASDADANDAADDTITLTFSITVEADIAPDFGMATIADQIFVPDRSVALTLPAVEAPGNDVTSYTLSTLPAGLTFNATSRVLSGRPTAVTTATMYTYTARDSDANNAADDTATLTFSITVEADIVPDFGDGVTIDDQTYIMGTAIPPMTLPEATGGNGALTYALIFNNTLTGLTFDPVTRVLTGTPLVAATNSLFTLVVMDADDNEEDSDTDRRPFFVNVMEAPDTAPAFADDASIDAQTFTVGTEIGPLTLPEATGGNGILRYALTPPIAGLTLNSTSRVLSGAPTAVTPATMYAYTASDADANNAADDTDTLIFSITVELDIAPDFGAHYIGNHIFAVGAPVALTLPVATGGNGALTYQLSTNVPVEDGASVLGLTWNAADRTLTGTPAHTGVLHFRWSARDSDANDASRDTARLSFSIRVVVAGTDIAPAFAAGVSIPDQTYIAGETVALTLPVVATPGNGATRYFLIRPGLDVVDGGRVLDLSYNAADRTLTGTPTVGQIHLYWVARDSDADRPGTGDQDTLTFTITVLPDTAPVFGMVVPDQSYVMGTAIPPLTLPPATRGNGLLRYTLTPALPAGLTHDPATRIITGTPTTVQAATTYDYRVVDGDDNNTMTDADLQMFTITVVVAGADIAPTFGGVAMPDQFYVVNLPMPPLTLPVATGGNGAITYALTPALPAGLTFNAATRVLIGTPQALTSSEIFTYTASDSDPNTATGDTDTLTFSITVGTDIVPAFADGVFMPFQTYIVGESVALTLPAVETPGNGPTFYTLVDSFNDRSVADGESVQGLTYNAAARTLTGTVTAEANFYDYEWVASDSDANNTADDVDSLFVFIYVEANTAPAFAVTSIAAQTYRQDALITPLTLPRATGGNGDITYTLTPAIAGLTLNPTSRVLSGAPTTVTTATMYTYTASDSDANIAADDTATLTFSITVEADIVPAFGDGVTIDDQTYIMGQMITPLTLPAVEAPGNGATHYTLTPPIAGLTLNPTTRVLSGRPTAVTTATMYTYTASDSDPNTATDDTATLTFSITVEAAIFPAFFAASIPRLTYIVGQMITPLTLPVVTGGNVVPNYSLSAAGAQVADGASVLGLTYNAAARTLTGTPTTSAVLNLQWSASNSDYGYTTSQGFRITVVAEGTDIAPDFGGSGIGDRYFDFGQTVALTLPVATGGNGALSYSLYAAGEGTPMADGASVLGLTYNAAARTLTGTATPGTIELYWFASDSDADHPDSVSQNFNITVRPDIAPVFGTVTVPDQSYIMGTAITPLTLPEALYGNLLLRYTLTPTLPAGLTFDPATRTLTGTPTTVQAATTYDYVVVDGDGNNTMTDADLQMFSITVAAAADDIAPTFGVVAMADQFYGMNRLITPLTLPVATGGNGVLSYSLSAAGAPVADGASVLGLTWNAAARTLTGTATPGTRSFTWLASDSDLNTATGDTDTLTFSITVEADSIPNFTVVISGQSYTVGIPDQRYIVGQMITPLTLPEATGGNGILTYILYNRTDSVLVTDGASVLGLTYNAADRTLTGTPTTEAYQLTLQWSAHDADNDYTYSSPTFNITVVAAGSDIAPTFGGARVGNTSFDFGETVALTLPVATGGNGALSYSLEAANAPVVDGASVLGLTYNAAARTLTGTATTGTLSFRWNAIDSDDDTKTLTFDIRVRPDIAPVFGTATVPDQSYIMGTAIPPLTLPVATLGNVLLRYTLTPTLPAGLTFDPATRTLTGTPTTVQAATTYDYVVVDGDGNNTMTDADLQMFSITVAAAADDIAPTFGVVAMADQFYGMNRLITPLTLPVATGGNGVLSYSLSAAGAPVADGASVLGLTWNAAARTLTGTATPGTRSFTWLASDSDLNTATGDTDTLTFSITVEADSIPNFTVVISGQSYTVGIPDQRYIVGQMITPLTLPEATGGNGILTYILYNRTDSVLVTDGASVLGLTYNAADRTLTGTPTTEAYQLTLQWSAHDADNDYTYSSPTFNITVVAAGSDIAPTFGGARVGNTSFDFGETVALTLPVATGGNGALSYSLEAANAPVVDGASVLGLTYNAAARTLTGTATTGTLSFRWNAIDSDDDTKTLTFDIRVRPDIAPVFGTATVPDQSYIMGTAIPPLTLPVATLGNVLLRYTLTPTLPAGLTFDPATRTLTGTPTTVQAATTYDYVVVDGDGNNTMTDADLQMFSITVAAAGDGHRPDFRRGGHGRPVLWHEPADYAADPAGRHWRQRCSQLLSVRCRRTGGGRGECPGSDLERRRPHPHWHGDPRDAFLHLVGERLGPQHCNGRHRHADLQHYGGGGQHSELHRCHLWPELHRRHPRPALHRGSDDYAADSTGSHRRQRYPHLYSVQ